MLRRRGGNEACSRYQRHAEAPGRPLEALEASVTGDLDMLHLKLRLKADKDAEEQAKLEVPPLHAMLAFPMQQKRSRVAG